MNFQFLTMLENSRNYENVTKLKNTMNYCFCLITPSESSAKISNWYVNKKIYMEINTDTSEL